MRFRDLHQLLLSELAIRLPGWRFVKSDRAFRQKSSSRTMTIHVSFINHERDFDATVDVAVEHFTAGQRLCIVGAELGNIEGVGQKRFSVQSAEDCAPAAADMFDSMQSVGLPFLEKLSDLPEVFRVLKEDQGTALLISPIRRTHGAQLVAIEKHLAAEGRTPE